MNWKAILGFSLIGVAIGFADVAGIPGWVRWPALFGVGVFFALWLTKNLPSKQPLHGFLIGLIAGLITPAIQTIFFDYYVENNPQAAAGLLSRATQNDLDPRQLMLSAAPVIGLFQGIALAVFTWTVVNLYRRPVETEAHGGSPVAGNGPSNTTEKRNKPRRSRVRRPR